MLRGVLLGIGIAALIVAAILFVRGMQPVAIYVGFQGLALTLGVAFERWRYRGRVHSRNAVPTGERFYDPTTGKLVQVLHDPQTGERQYQEIAK